jgi:hypothetical protein
MYQRVLIGGAAIAVIAAAIVGLLRILDLTSASNANEALLRSSGAIVLVTAVALVLVWLARRARANR